MNAPRTYYEANREKIIARSKAYYAANKEKIAEQKKSYQSANKEKISQQRKSHYDANKDEIIERERSYQSANKEKVSQQRKARYGANKEHHREYRESRKEYRKAYNIANRAKMREYSLLRNYNLTVAQWDDLYTQQKGQCAICLTHITEKNAHTDHCHITGRVRGLLCSKCNTGLGSFDDDPEMLLRAYKFVASHMNEGEGAHAS